LTIFIDPPAWPAHGRLWSHLVSDASLDELHVFATACGVPRRGFERDHYDVPAERYDDLVAKGAVPVSSRELVGLLHRSGLRKRKAVAMSRKAPGRELLRPPRLRSGDLVAVVATSGVLIPERLRPGLDRLESWGLRVQVGSHVFDRDAGLGYLAGADADRAADFTAAWQDPTVHAIVVARGGYGAQRIVDLLDWRRLAEGTSKALVGFSDVTALHQALASRLGLVSIHGHVVTSLGAADDASADQLRRILMEPDDLGDLFAGQPVETIVPGAAEGVLLGGNLSVLAAEVGTSSVRLAKGGIVLLEEIDEEPYRIDRLLTQLVRSGWLEGVHGIVCGAFTNCGNPVRVAETLRRRLSPLGVPAVAGLDIGHTPTTLSLPLGVRARLDADAGSLNLSRPPLG
jgi:muramoyltetrapeptide carboxypeptidase